MHTRCRVSSIVNSSGSAAPGCERHKADPALLNDFRVSRTFITGEGQPLDEEGAVGRCHLYWVDVPDAEIDRVQAGTRHGWYAHFWQGDRLVVVFDDARFELASHAGRGEVWGASGKNIGSRTPETGHEVVLSSRAVGASWVGSSYAFT